MQININLSEEQIKALLTYYPSIEGYVQIVVRERARRIIDNLVRDYASGKFGTTGITTDEQNVINSKLANKIIVQPEDVPDEIKNIIVKRINVKSIVEKIEEQEKIAEAEPIILDVADSGEVIGIK